MGRHGRSGCSGAYGRQGRPLPNQMRARVLHRYLMGACTMPRAPAGAAGGAQCTQRLAHESLRACGCERESSAPFKRLAAVPCQRAVHPRPRAHARLGGAVLSPPPHTHTLSAPRRRRQCTPPDAACVCLCACLPARLRAWLPSSEADSQGYCAVLGGSGWSVSLTSQELQDFVMVGLQREAPRSRGAGGGGGHGQQGGWGVCHCWLAKGLVCW